MISSIHTKSIQPHNRVQASAMKVFGEADGDAASVVPGLEDSYDDLACEFLTGWLAEKPSMETIAAGPQKEVAQPEAPKAPEPPATVEPKFTSFTLGQEWNLLS